MAVFDALESQVSIDKRDYTRGLRDAAKETLSFGSVAEGTFDDVGDEAAEAGAEAAASSGGFRRLADSAGDAVVPMRLVSSAADAAGDEISEAGRNALGTASGFAALRVSSTGLSFSLGMVSAIGSSTILILGGLAVAAGALATAMLPVIIGAGAIAAAFGVIVGSGIVAGMKELKTAFSAAKAEIIPMVAELGERFVPFLKETIQMLPGLVQSLIDSLGPLDQFFSALQNLRRAAFNLLPQLISWFFDLGRWAIPVVANIARWMVDSLAPAFARTVERGKWLVGMFGRMSGTGASLSSQISRLWSWIQDLANVFERSAASGTSLQTEFNQLVSAAQRFATNAQPTVSSLRDLATELARAAPVVAKVAVDLATMGVNIGTKLLPVANSLVQFITGLVRWFNGLSSGMQRAIVVVGGLALALGPIISIVTTVVSVIGTLVSVLTTVGSVILTVVTFFNPLTLAIAALVAAAVGLYVAWQNNFLGIRDITMQAIGIVKQTIRDAVSWISSNVPGWLQTALKIAFAPFYLQAKLLYDWFIGNSLIPDMFTAVVNYIAGTATSLVRSAITTWVDAIKFSVIDFPSWIMDIFTRAISSVVGWLTGGGLSDMVSAAHQLGRSAADSLRSAFNSVLPDRLPIPSVTIGGGSYMGEDIPSLTVGGGSIDIPALASGGFIEQGGLAMLHAGEQVVPSAQVDREEGGGGPQQMIVQLDADAVMDLMRGEAVDVFDDKVQSTERKKRRRGTR